MKIFEFESVIFDMEEVRIVVRGETNVELDDYDFDRKAASNASITDWLNARIHPRVHGHEVIVIAGDGSIPHGRTKMETLRNTYSR